MKVLCTGPESSGTRMLTKLVDLLDVESIHTSIPNNYDWWYEVEADATLFICRDPFITAISAEEALHLNKWRGTEDALYPNRLTKAWMVFIDNVKTPWLPLTYEGLLMRPQWTLDNIAEWLGIESATVNFEIKDPRKDIA